MVSIYNTGVIAPDTSFQNNRSSRETGYFPIAGVDLFTLSTKPGNVVIGHKNLPVFSFKNHPSDYLALRKASESYHVNNWSEYIFFATNVVIRLQPADIIFPFQYFW